MKSQTPVGEELDREQIERWIEEAKVGSPDALGHLLQTCRDYLLYVAQRGLSAPIRAKVSPSDLVQETSLDAYRDFARFRGERLEELLAWLRQILLHNASNAVRRFQRVDKRKVSREVPLESAPGIALGLRDDALSPRSLLATIDEQQAIECALLTLSEEQRTIILLRNRSNLSFVEIGERMDRSPDAVRKMWFRAVERLHSELKPDERD